MHLFIYCSFTRAVWENIKRHTKIAHNWNGNNLCECITHWIEAKTGSPSLAAYTCWNIWLARNAAIFVGKEPSVTTVIIKSMCNYHKPVIKHKKTHPCSCLNTDLIEYPVAFFDGAAQGDGRCCGA